MAGVMLAFRGGPLDGKMANCDWKEGYAPEIGTTIQFGENLAYQVASSNVNAAIIGILKDGLEVPKSLGLTFIYIEPETISETSA